MLFKCTAKVKAEFGSTNRGLVDGPVDNPGSFHEWYCNLFHLERHKCLILTEATTLFSFIVPGIRRNELRDFGKLFRSQAVEALFNDGFTRTQAKRLMDDGPDYYAKADSRAVLGSMTDLVRMCRFQVSRHGGFDRADFSRINIELNSTPMSWIGMQGPSECLRSILALHGIN